MDLDTWQYLPATADATVQEKFLALCERIMGVRLDAL